MSENGFIYDIRRFCIHDGPGIRTTVFFKGCPLSCCWCHNPESRSAEIQHAEKEEKVGLNVFTFPEVIGWHITPDKLLKEIEKDLFFYEESGGGVTFSGGEPLLQPDFLYEIISFCKSVNIHTAVDTCGFAKKEILQKISGIADLFLFDLKIMNDVQHKKHTGVSNAVILENLTFLLTSDASVNVRIPVIPDITDGAENIGAMIDFLSSFSHKPPVTLLPFHNTASQKYIRLEMMNPMAGVGNTDPSYLIPFQKQFQKAGFATEISR